MKVPSDTTVDRIMPRHAESPAVEPVSVVVVNWNGRQWLDRCLSSLMIQDYPELEVVLVDNGSSDDSLDFVRANFPSVKVVRSTTNLGYAGGCNLGAQESRGRFVVLLNNDTKLSPNLVTRLVRTLEDNPSMAAVSGLAVESLEDGEHLPARTPIFNVLGKHFAGTYDPDQLFYAPGACVMFRRDLANPPFDADYFAYDEDVYLSWRLRLQGYSVGLDTGAIFEHEPYSTSRRIKGYVRFCAERNRWTNVFLFYSYETLAKIAPLALLNMIAKILFGGEDKAAKARAYIWIVMNARTILSKRSQFQSQRTVSDAALTRYMTGAVTVPSSRPRRLANRIVLSYLRRAGVSTLETIHRR